MTSSVTPDVEDLHGVVDELGHEQVLAPGDDLHHPGGSGTRTPPSRSSRSM